MRCTLREGDEVWVKAKVIDRESGGGDMGHWDYSHVRVNIETRKSGYDLPGDEVIIHVNASDVVKGEAVSVIVKDDRE